MGLDWDSIGTDSGQPLVRPREIYSAIVDKPWPYLRQEQGELLEKWFPRRDDRDIVIKQNTGGGKTVAGLLIAQSTLNEGVGPAVYLAPDTYLAARVTAEAHKLGFVTAKQPRDPNFQSGQAILITTFQKLINGKSVFGVVGDDRPRIDLGVVVVDDAHAALATTENQFRLRIPSSHAAYFKLRDLFESDLRAQSHKVWEDIKAGDYSAAARIPFWSWADRGQQVMEILHPYRSDEEFEWTWPLIAHVLHLCSATVTPRDIEIRPPCPPIETIPSFAHAKRRVYLTATLADDSVLVTDLDANPAEIVHPVSPGSAADLGDRMILSPVTLNSELDDTHVRELARQFSLGDRDGDGVAEARPVNVVVLVPSGSVAKKWSSLADRTLYVGDLEAGVEELKAGHVGLVVLVNKYDGVDLPRAACELLVIDGIPQPMDAVERREALALRSSTGRQTREVQRIEQGMGRGVRDSDDHCAVLLVGTDLGLAVHNPTLSALFSPATRAQLDLSRSLALSIAGGGIAAVREALCVFLDRDPKWVERSRRALAKIKYDETGSVRPDAIAARQAFDLAAAGQTQDAADRIQKAVNDADEDNLRGWLLEQKAAYVHFTNSSSAQTILSEAVKKNPYVLRPAAGISFAAAKPARAQARASAEFLGATYPDQMALVLGVRSVVNRIEWDEELTPQAELAWEQLGLHLGFDSSRPEKTHGTGPDNLWILGNNLHAVTELKTGCTTDTIAKKDADQLGGSVRWDQDNYADVKSLPVLVHPSRTLHEKALKVDGMRVVTPSKLDELKAAVIAFAVALADGLGSWQFEQSVSDQLSANRLLGPDIFNRYGESAK